MMVNSDHCQIIKKEKTDYNPNFRDDGEDALTANDYDEDDDAANDTAATDDDDDDGADAADGTCLPA